MQENQNELKEAENLTQGNHRVGDDSLWIDPLRRKVKCYILFHT